jgi:hypothetical protein
MTTSREQRHLAAILAGGVRRREFLGAGTRLRATIDFDN